MKEGRKEGRKELINKSARGTVYVWLSRGGAGRGEGVGVEGNSHMKGAEMLVVSVRSKKFGFCFWVFWAKRHYIQL